MSTVTRRAELVSYRVGQLRRPAERATPEKRGTVVSMALPTIQRTLAVGLVGQPQLR